jgi:hypothetical protein
MKSIQIVCPKPLNSRKGCERSKQYSDDHGSNTFYGSLVGPRGGISADGSMIHEGGVINQRLE